MKDSDVFEWQSCKFKLGTHRECFETVMHAPKWLVCNLHHFAFMAIANCDSQIAEKVHNVQFMRTVRFEVQDRFNLEAVHETICRWTLNQFKLFLFQKVCI